MQTHQWTDPRVHTEDMDPPDPPMTPREGYTVLGGLVLSALTVLGLVWWIVA